MGKSTINPFSMAMLVHQRVDVALKARCPMTPPFSPWFSRGPGWVPPSRLCPAWGWRSTHHSFRPLPHVSRMVRDIYPGSMDHLLTIYWPFTDHLWLYWINMDHLLHISYLSKKKCSSSFHISNCSICSIRLGGCMHVCVCSVYE